jgi:phage terminase small subunit
MDEELNPKELIFSNTYISNNFNAKKAAITAGYSENTAEVKGSQLLSKVKVRDYIKNR